MGPVVPAGIADSQRSALERLAPMLDEGTYLEPWMTIQREILGCVKAL